MGRTVLITGGSRGIGYATAKAFLERGAQVAICSLDHARLAHAEEHLRPLGDLFAHTADVTAPVQIHELVSKTIRHFGKIDVLVNSAGRAWRGDFVHQDLRSVGKDIDVNVKGVLFVTRVVLPHMLEKRSGVIINLSSGLGLAGAAGFAGYCASKFAVVGFTESLAQEVERAGVRVFAVCPGRVATDMQAEIAGRRMGMPPEELAAHRHR